MFWEDQIRNFLEDEKRLSNLIEENKALENLRTVEDHISRNMIFNRSKVF